MSGHKTETGSHPSGFPNEIVHHHQKMQIPRVTINPGRISLRALPTSFTDVKKFQFFDFRKPGGQNE